MPTRKHFEATARILRTTRMSESLRAFLALEFSRVFQEQNPRFDESRFLTEAIRKK